jgi:hypothetical protein
VEEREEMGGRRRFADVALFKDSVIKKEEKRDLFWSF